MRRSAGVALALFCVGLAQLTGCASVASSTPAEVVAGVAKNSDLRITWFGAEREDSLFGFPVVDRQLEPIQDKCRQQQGLPFAVRQSLRFAGPSLKKGGYGEKPEFVRTVTTEIQCKQGEAVLWVARINYGDHRFYADIQNRERIQLRLRTSFLLGEAYVRQAEEAAKVRRADDAAAIKASREQYEEEQRRLTEVRRVEKERREVEEERRQALRARLIAERPAFQAGLKTGARVQWLDHHAQSTGEPARGLIVEIKRPLALVQFDIPNGFGATTTQTRWVAIDELGPP